MKIVIDNKIPFINGVFDEIANVVYLPGAEFSRSIVKDADALIIRTRTKCDATLLQNTSVKFIATATIGHDHIDDDFCRQVGIEWTNAPGCNSYSVMQYFVSAFFTISEQMDFDPVCKTVGIVGLGNVGSKVYNFLNLLGIKTILNDPPLENKIKRVKSGLADIEELKFFKALPEFIKNAEFQTLNNIMENSDIISLHVPLVSDGQYSTFHLCDDLFFNNLKNNEVFLFNTSRGEVVDNNALKNALKIGTLTGGVLDVWENEPIIDPELLSLLNVATPHIAGYSADGKAEGTAMSVGAVSRFFDLGLDNWRTENIPKPNETLINFDKSIINNIEIIKNAFLQTYNILDDNNALCADIQKFEYLRGHYPLRREPNAFTIVASDLPEITLQTLKHFHFNIKVD
jgi:erythronate-4-phosphate dehydrogenase